MLEVMDEIRDVMVQYASCADPTESATRRERLRQAKEAGDFEETAAQMVRSSLDLHNQGSLLKTQPVQDAQERIPITFRLGPAYEYNESGKSNKNLGPVKRKKLGRPLEKRLLNSVQKLCQELTRGK